MLVDFTELDIAGELGVEGVLALEKGIPGFSMQSWTSVGLARNVVLPWFPAVLLYPDTYSSCAGQ